MCDLMMCDLMCDYMRKNTFICFICFLLIGLASCSNARQVTDDANSLEKKANYNYSAEAQLAEAANSISRSMVDLKKIQQAAMPPVHTTQPPPPASYDMAGLASVDWMGPVEPLLHKLAVATEYKVNIIGQAPGIPILVAVNEKNTPLGEIIRNIGYQCGKKADLIIFPAIKTIELRYANS